MLRKVVVEVRLPHACLTLQVEGWMIALETMVFSAHAWASLVVSWTGLVHGSCRAECAFLLAKCTRAVTGRVQSICTTKTQAKQYLKCHRDQA